MNQMSESTKIDAYKFEIEDDCGFQHIEEDFHTHRDDKSQYAISLDLHDKLHVTRILYIRN